MSAKHRSSKCCQTNAERIQTRNERRCTSIGTQRIDFTLQWRARSRCHADRVAAQPTSVSIDVERRVRNRSCRNESHMIEDKALVSRTGETERSRCRTSVYQNYWCGYSRANLACHADQITCTARRDRDAGGGAVADYRHRARCTSLQVDVRVEPVGDA